MRAGPPSDWAPRACSEPGGALRLHAAQAQSESQVSAANASLEAIFGSTHGTQDGSGGLITGQAARDTLDDGRTIDAHEGIGRFFFRERRGHGRFTTGALLRDA